VVKEVCTPLPLLSVLYECAAYGIWIMKEEEDEG
jgi:hypothetical protein